MAQIKTNSVRIPIQSKSFSQVFAQFVSVQSMCLKLRFPIILATILLMQSGVTHALPMACEDVFLPRQESVDRSMVSKGLHLIRSLFFKEQIPVDKLSPENRQMILALGEIEKSLHEGLLTQRSFEKVNALQKYAATYADHLKKLTPEERREERRYLLLKIDRQPELRYLFDYLESGSKLPTEYDLKREFVRKMIEVYRILPEDFRPRITRPVRDQRNKELNVKAKELLEVQLAHFDAAFKTTGFSDYKAFEKYLRKSKDPAIMKAIEILDQNSLNFVTRAPEEVRFWVSKLGFQNQFVTKRSGGALNLDYRDIVESSGMNELEYNYKNYDPELKPKYGTIITNDKAGIDTELGHSKRYGSDLYYFKKELVESRMSFYPGDTLNQYTYLKRSNLLTATERTWQRLFIPWKRRLMMVPFMLGDIANNKFGNPEYNQDIAAAHDLKLKEWNQFSTSYWEYQIFGRLDLSMVESFEFRTNPPEGEFLRDLRKYNIKIMDGRNGKPVEWSGP